MRKSTIAFSRPELHEVVDDSVAGQPDIVFVVFQRHAGSDLVDQGEDLIWLATATDTGEPRLIQ